MTVTELLRHSPITNGADVVSIERRRVGAGQVASCWHLDLTIEGRDGTVGVVVKGPSSDPTSLATANAQHLYEREVRFYELVASDVAIRTPTCFASTFDAATGGFLLVLESMLPAQTSDQLVGLSRGLAAVAVTELAGLHGPMWGEASRGLCFADDVADSLRPLYLQLVPALFTGFLDRYGDQVTSPTRSVIEWLVPRLGTYLAGRGGPQTVIHGDFRTDNLIFGGRGGTVPMATVDWQTVAHGCGALDLAYLLTTSLEPEVRRRTEHELLATYHDRLHAQGVADYSAQSLFDDYAWHAFQGVVMLVCSAMLVVRTERGDAMFLTMIERGTVAIEDLDARARLET
ncbi:MAG TPA: oxidoreductase family protein [Acidimicrobiales bacterium]|nr:oxidoreductase family protein [Acidimicrobiales bacterium]